jgi:putative heme transporter
LTDGVDAPAEPGARAAAPLRARAPRRYRLRRSMLAVLAVAVLVSVIVVERHTLAESLHVLASLNWAWFLLAFASEVISLSSFGLSRMLLMRVNGRPTTFRSVMAVTYAANALSISVPFAGAELAMVFSYRQFRRHGVDAATTGWTLAVSAICSTSALALLLVIGAIAGSASLATAAGFLGAFVFIVPGAAVLLALRYQNIRQLLHRLIAGLVSLSRRVFGVPAQGVDGLDDFLDRVASLRLPWFRYAEVFGLALLNWAADCGALACAIRAMGQPVPWHSLLLVYGAGAAVGSTGITPGGFAIVELALTAALTAAGLHRSPALAAVLAYRLVNFWLVLICGWILMAILAHRRIGPAQDAAAEDALTCRSQQRSRWPTWRQTRIPRSRDCGRPGRPAGCPPWAHGWSPGTTWRSMCCGTQGRSPSMTRGSPPPRWSARACSRWTARSTCATARPSPAPSAATRSGPGSPISLMPRPNAWCRPSGREARRSCAARSPGRLPSP